MCNVEIGKNKIKEFRMLALDYREWLAKHNSLAEDYRRPRFSGIVL
jgi:hypothetical protein